LDNRKAVAKTEGGEEVLSAVDNWQQGVGEESFNNRREGGETWMSGGDPPTDPDALAGYTLAESIASSGPSDDVLYRGIAAQNMSVADVESAYAPNSSFDLLPSSFSTNQTIADDFSGNGVIGTDTPVLFELEKGSQAFNIEGISTSGHGVREKERITMGRYEITGTERFTNAAGENGVRVKMKQSNSFGEVAGDIPTPKKASTPVPSAGPSAPTPPTRRRRRTTPTTPPPARTPSAPVGSGNVTIPGFGTVTKAQADAMLANLR